MAIIRRPQAWLSYSFRGISWKSSRGREHPCIMFLCVGDVRRHRGAAARFFKCPGLYDCFSWTERLLRQCVDVFACCELLTLFSTFCRFCLLPLQASQAVSIWFTFLLFFLLSLHSLYVATFCHLKETIKFLICSDNNDSIKRGCSRETVHICGAIRANLFECFRAPRLALIASHQRRSPAAKSAHPLSAIFFFTYLCFCFAALGKSALGKHGCVSLVLRLTQLRATIYSYSLAI